MKKLNTEYWKKLLETVAFSNGEISLYELVQKEHRHFHPSGNLAPSDSDTQITDRMIRLCNLMGIRFLDHIIVGGVESEYFSLKKQEVLPRGCVQLKNNYKELDFDSSAVAEVEEPTRAIRGRHR